MWGYQRIFKYLTLTLGIWYWFEPVWGLCVRSANLEYIYTSNWLIGLTHWLFLLAFERFFGWRGAICNMGLPTHFQIFDLDHGIFPEFGLTLGIRFEPRFCAVWGGWFEPVWGG